MQDKRGGSKWGVQVCLLGPEPQGTPNHIFLPPNGSPSHHLGFYNRDPAQNSGPDLAVGVTGPESQFVFAYFGPPNAQKYIFCEDFEFIRDP